MKSSHNNRGTQARRGKGNSKKGTLVAKGFRGGVTCVCLAGRPSVVSRGQRAKFNNMQKREYNDE